MNSRLLKFSTFLNGVLLLLLGGKGISYILNHLQKQHLKPISQSTELNYDLKSYLIQCKSLQLMPARQYHLVFVGDSLTAGARWHEWFTGRSILERGLSGDMTQGIAQRLPEIIRHHPSVIVLEGGINDISRGDTAEMVALSLQRIIAEIHRQLPHAIIVLQSIYPVNPTVSEAQGVKMHPNINATIQQVNAALSHLPSGKPYIQWVDVNRHLADKTGELDSRYAIDGVHINAEGYRVVAEALRPFVEH